MLKFVEETLDEIAFAIEDAVAETWNFSGELGRNDRCDASPVEAFDESVGIEGFVGDQSAWINGFDQRFGAGQIMGLTGAEHNLDRITQGIDKRVDFGAQSASRSANGLRAVFFWAPALCW